MLESFDLVCEAVSTNSSMKTLNVGECYLTLAHCKSLGQLLLETQIKKLVIRECGITSDGIREVMCKLSDNHTLRELDLNFNPIGSEGAYVIATVLKKNRSLERLYLDRCGIDSRGGVELGATLQSNKTLKQLRLSDNALGDDGVKGLSAGLENNSSLEELRLDGDESLGEEGVSALLKCMKEKNTSLKKLVKYIQTHN